MVKTSLPTPVVILFMWLCGAGFAVVFFQPAFGLLLSLCFLCGTEVVTDVKLVWLGWMVYLPIADLCCHIVKLLFNF